MSRGSPPEVARERLRLARKMRWVDPAARARISEVRRAWWAEIKAWQPPDDLREMYAEIVRKVGIRKGHRIMQEHMRIRGISE